jgi:hypothetical protein
MMVGVGLCKGFRKHRACPSNGQRRYRQRQRPFAVGVRRRQAPLRVVDPPRHGGSVDGRVTHALGMACRGHGWAVYAAALSGAGGHARHRRSQCWRRGEHGAKADGRAEQLHSESMRDRVSRRGENIARVTTVACVCCQRVASRVLCRCKVWALVACVLRRCGLWFLAGSLSVGCLTAHSSPRVLLRSSPRRVLGPTWYKWPQLATIV